MKAAIVGATGIVGEMFLKVLEERDFPVEAIHPYASSRSAGGEVYFKGERFKVRGLSAQNIEACDLALFSAGSEAALQWALKFVAEGALVVDNSSAFRANPDVPLVAPEVNPEKIITHKGIIANPNCSSIGLVVSVYPLHHRFRLKSMIVTSFQSVSGAGREAMEELEAQLIDPSFPPLVFPGTIAGNCIPQIGDFLADGETAEERKFRDESRKIMGIPELNISATAVRVPVKIGHSLAVFAQFENPVSPEKAMDILRNAPGVKVFMRKEDYNTSIEAAGSDFVFVSRVRQAPGFENSLNLWITLDNLRKGAATNAIRIAEMALLDQNWW